MQTEIKFKSIIPEYKDVFEWYWSPDMVIPQKGDIIQVPSNKVNDLKKRNLPVFYEVYHIVHRYKVGGFAGGEFYPSVHEITIIYGLPKVEFPEYLFQDKVERWYDKFLSKDANKQN